MDCSLPAPPPQLVPQLILRVPWRVTRVASYLEGTAFGLGLEVATARPRHSAQLHLASSQALRQLDLHGLACCGL